jgi:hypothetical protein
MQIDAAVKLVWLGVEAHEVSSSLGGYLPSASSPTAVCRGGDLDKYQPPAADAQERAAHAWPFGISRCKTLLSIAWVK